MTLRRATFSATLLATFGLASCNTKTFDAPCSPPTTSFVNSYPGYEFKEENWACWPNPMPHDIRVNQDFFPATLGIAPGDASGSLQTAIDAWMAVPGHGFSMTHNNSHTSDLATKGNGSVATADPGYDSRQQRSYAITYLRVDVDDPEHATECDSVFFKKVDKGNVQPTISWSLETDGSQVGSSEMSLPAIWVHELGHCVGFADGNTHPGSVMNYSSLGPGLGVPPLAVADEEAIKHLY